MRAVIVGIGQPMAGDDGVGIAVARALAIEGFETRTSTDASMLLPLLEEGRRVVVVDAVVGGGAVGSVARYDASSFAREAAPVSSHGLGVVEAIELAATLYGDDCVRSVSVVGVSIEAPTGAGGEMSAAVAAAVATAAAMARAIAEEVSFDA